VLLADETASAEGFFRGENCEPFKVGNVVAIKNGTVRIMRGHICLELSDCGRITEETVNVKENPALNISAPEVRYEYRKSDNYGHRVER
jgi:ssDNA-binding replication factor A large subunit